MDRIYIVDVVYSLNSRRFNSNFNRRILSKVSSGFILQSLKALEISLSI